MTKELPIAIDIIKKGGILLYPTDTVYGLGCDACDEKAIERIAKLKNRPSNKSYIILVNSIEDLKDLLVDYKEEWFAKIPNDKPTTIIYPKTKNLPKAVLAEDGSVAIRIINHPFCTALLKGIKTPLISTSANISGEPSPSAFTDISASILQGVDYVVNLPAARDRVSEPSRIIKIAQDGEFITLRD